MLFKEAIVWHQLSHERILPFYGICDTLFPPELECTMLVSPWKELGDLAGFCDYKKKREFRGIDFVSWIVIALCSTCLIFSFQMEQIAQGLHYLHTRDPQIFHGDLRGVRLIYYTTS